MSVCPLIFTPIYKERIWGSDNLKRVFDKILPPGKKIGESWELADLPQDKSVIRNGPLAGLTLEQAIRQEGRRITGRDDFPTPFPLLIKLLDCAAVLSVQVHPDPDTCRRMGKGEFKTECWYIIQAEPGACIYKGLRPGVTRAVFEQAIADGTVEGLLNKITVAPGECHFLPAGTPHAIGAGLLIAEIQTPSDTTYRVFDWNRVDESGHGRPLHVAEALESIHFDASGDNLSVKRSGLLADSPHFTIEKKTVPARTDMKLETDRMNVLIMISGDGVFQGEGPPVPVRAGDTVLIPAPYRGSLSAAAGTCEYLRVTMGESGR